MNFVIKIIDLIRTIDELFKLWGGKFSINTKPGVHPELIAMRPMLKGLDLFEVICWEVNILFTSLVILDYKSQIYQIP